MGDFLCSFFESLGDIPLGQNVLSKRQERVENLYLLNVMIESEGNDGVRV